MCFCVCVCVCVFVCICVCLTQVPQSTCGGQKVTCSWNFSSNIGVLWIITMSGSVASTFTHETTTGLPFRLPDKIALCNSSCSITHWVTMESWQFTCLYNFSTLYWSSVFQRAVYQILTLRFILVAELQLQSSNTITFWLGVITPWRTVGKVWSITVENHLTGRNSIKGAIRETHYRRLGEEQIN